MTTTPVTTLLLEVVDGAADEVVVGVGAVVVTNAFPGIDVSSALAVAGDAVARCRRMISSRAISAST